MAAPDRDVCVLVGDASYLMMAQEIVTSVQEGHKLTVVLVDNHGFASIGALSRSLGSGGFGTAHRFREPASGEHTGETLPIDYAANAKSLGADAVRARTIAELKAALEASRKATKTTVIVVETDTDVRVGGYESWWDVPVAEVSAMEPVRKARAEYEEARKKERWHL
jgi:3D-(3,5/4)-trihydroxycyclohexane-1,2-dione acylhydrolase (decyclizing)